MASVVDERNMNGELWWNDTDSRKPKNSQDDLQRSHLVYRKCRIDWSVMETKVSR